MNAIMDQQKESAQTNETREAFEVWHEQYYGKGFNIMQNEIDAYQAATEAAKAKYLPLIEKLVGRLSQNNFVLSNVDDDSYVDIIRAQIRENSNDIALAAPLLKGEK